MTVLFATHPAYLEHLTGSGHPERPSRMQAVTAAATSPELGGAVVPLEPRPATRAELERVHPAWYLDRIEEMAEQGGGWIDQDTRMSGRSAEVARLAAGAGLAAIEALDRGDAEAAFCAVRPPGHHATRTTAMGFCLVSNIGVVAAALADRGERLESDDPGAAARLTARERKVLDLTAAGLDIRQVAQRLFLTPGTVHGVLAAAAEKTRERDDALK